MDNGQFNTTEATLPTAVDERLWQVLNTDLPAWFLSEVQTSVFDKEEFDTYCSLCHKASDGMSKEPPRGSTFPGGVPSW